jgi:hypothetical protein
MLNYELQYNVSQGIFLCFKNNLSTPLLHVNHSYEIKEKYSKILNYSKYLSYTQEEYILLCLYIMFTKNPSSINYFYEIINTIDTKENTAFKDVIMQYPKYIKQDIDYILETIGQPTSQQMYDLYVKNKIQFYTLWWFLVYKDDLKFLEQSKLREIHYRKIRSLLLYVKFDEKHLQYIKKILNASTLFLKGL